ncbi:ferredoxin--NADP reductase [Paludibacterium purpuratum]|uniref:ferredoxin--NADP(+) reductase n=1 Tax=Paludibacterium purpuratum TaxID=1144873 RepID=A0A4V3DU26_9NEIS|nr:ferredoxin--NADP reductase [Paludibacterium purpuratum]TDR70618.1 ferredoxin--NADP+ reductase [Paludibacterium purpuratum]
MSMPPAPSRPKHIAAPIRDIRQWAPNLWSIKIDKPEGFVFTPGHYVRLGIAAAPGHADGAIVWRAYSIVSAPAEPTLEFLITLIPDGAFTGVLTTLQPGGSILLEPAALGFFLAEQLSPGEHLWMLATGTGLGPYIAMLRQPTSLAAYRRLVLVHSVRHTHELAYAEELAQHAEASQGRLHYLPIVTRESDASHLHGRIPQLLAENTLQSLVQLPLDPSVSRVMVCGNPDFTADMRQWLNQQSFLPCRRGMAGSMLFENYW